MSRMQNIARPSGGRSDAPAKEVRGAQAPVKTLKRLLKYSFSRYKVATVFVILFVLLFRMTMMRFTWPTTILT